ncbi:MAG: hypothetical protein QM535_07730 [Limnohabitans sp.]|nr:hypothetical protein [Limnohabitans sp.]
MLKQADERISTEEFTTMKDLEKKSKVGSIFKKVRHSLLKVF